MNNKIIQIVSIVFIFFCQQAVTAQIVVNEFMASNQLSVADQDGEYDDWIELYNNFPSDVDISGYYLTDDGTNIMKWAFPEGTTIAGNGYLIVWADEDGSQEGLHANFKLARLGEVIFFSNTDGDLVDGVVYGEQVTDLSAARQPNGTGDFVIKQQSFNSNNDLVSYIHDVSLDYIVAVYPNPCKEVININTNAINADLVIFNALGQQVYQTTLVNSPMVGVDVSEWTNGLYFINIGTATTKVIVQH